MAIFILSACGTTAKETYTEAHQGLLDAQTYEVASTVSVNLTADDGLHDPEVQMILDLLNNAEIAVETRVDMEKEISEVVLYLTTNQGPVSFNLDIPMHVNMKEEKVYIQTDTISDALSMFLPVAADFTFEKEFIELDISTDLDVEEQEKLEQQMYEQVNELLHTVPEENFEEMDGVITLDLEGEQVRQLIVSLVESALEQSGEILEDTDKQELENELEKIEINNFSIEAQIENGKMKSEDITFSLAGGEAGEKLTIELAVNNDYKSIDENIEFTMEPTKDNAMTQEELEEQISQVFMQSMFDESFYE